MEYAGIVIGLAGLVVAWLAIRRAQQLEQRIDSLYDRYFTLSNRLREMDEETQTRLVDLGVELRRQSGLLKFEPQMTIQQVYDMHPRAADVLADFHLGGCSSCAVSLAQTLGDAAGRHNVNLDRLLGALRTLADGPGEAPGARTRFQSDPDLPIVA
ncbi:MAG: hypothetical protein HZB53_06370 [Chloroflexi bacterium]|nr:hypothetical protein [Chloroflexota bacterium]